MIRIQRWSDTSREHKHGQTSENEYHGPAENAWDYDGSQAMSADLNHELLYEKREPAMKVGTETITPTPEALEIAAKVSHAFIKEHGFAITTD